MEVLGIIQVIQEKEDAQNMQPPCRTLKDYKAGYVHAAEQGCDVLAYGKCPGHLVMFSA